VDTVDDAAKRIKETGGLDVLLGDVKNLQTKLTDARGEQEKNLAEIENSVDEITSKTEKTFKQLVDHLEIQKNKHLDAAAGALKKGREKLSNGTNVLTDGIQCLEYCSRNIERVGEMANNAEIVMTYYGVRERLAQMKHFAFTKKNISISETESPFGKELSNAISFGNVEYSECVRRVIYDVNDIALSFVSEFGFGERNPNVLTGNFLSNGNFIVSEYKPGGECFIYSKDWQSREVIGGLNFPFEAIQVGEELFVTSESTQTIEVFSVHDLHKLRSMKINAQVFGITKYNEVCYLACKDKIVEIDMAGKILRTYTVGGSCNLNITVTKDGHIVYSDCVFHTVTAMTDQGDRVWQYTHPSMKTPRGLEMDSVGNIFVAAETSDNIHVLSGEGDLIRIIEDIPRPFFY
jgi:hypothetical protein